MIPVSLIASAALSADDDELETIYGQQHLWKRSPLRLSSRPTMNWNHVRTLFSGAAPAVSRAQEEEEYEPAPVSGGFNDSDITPKSSFRQKMESSPSTADEDDDALSYFARLAED